MLSSFRWSEDRPAGHLDAREDRSEEKGIKEIALLLSQTHSLPYVQIENEVLVGSAPIGGWVLECRPMHDAFVVAIRVSSLREARPVAGHG